jgi:hypothetical protein
MFHSLRFGRVYRVLGPLGAALLVIAVLGIAPEWTWLLVLAGIALAVAFVWIPFWTKYGATTTTVVATREGLTFSVGGVTNQSSWGSVRAVHPAGSSVLVEFVPAGTVVIPRRAFREGELDAFEALATAGRGSQPGSPGPSGEPVLIRARTSLRFQDTVAIVAFRPAMLGPIILGVVLIAAGVSEVLAPSSDPFKSVALPLLAGGVLFLTLPLWGAALRVYLGGGVSAMTDAYEVEIGSSGFRARLGNADSWTSWDSFQSVRRVGPVYALRLRDSKAEVLLSTRGLPAADQVTFRQVLRAAGIKGA